ncbi:hypothetical protein DBR32_05900 [Taibaiella sp. KBW10]|uniref:ComEC/Rec2 family competence protein n=1 Tax=Taibaiella sp. KBW10 TaxID=2153357 RepID=UPI000F5A8CCA|nr:ComEC/Rec2 family competence protein [Taibaiella sp. KBW10]RQO31489.1 hypothetical protein DBR32_05900 [Taibaiella sp. KBW10]
MSFFPTPKKVPLLYLLIALIAGILIEDNLLQVYSRAFWYLLLSSCLLLLLLLLVLEKYKQRSFQLTKIMAFVSIIFLGMGLTAFQDVRSAPDWLGHQPEKYSAFHVKIIEEPAIKAKTVLLKVQVLSGLRDSMWQPLSGKSLVYVYRNSTAIPYTVGQEYIIPNELKDMQHNQNPFAFNFVQKQQREGFYHHTFLTPDALCPAGGMTEKGYLSVLRQSCLRYMDRYIPEQTTQALCKATLFNEKADMDAFMKNAYAATGITHIIAISGMHVQMLFALCLLPFFWIRDKRKLWIKYLMVVPFVWIYVALCDFPPSAIRAGVSFSLIALALLLKRPVKPIQLWALTAFVMLCSNTMWLFHVGVQLSFLAVLSILIFYRPIRRLVFINTKIGRLAWDTVAISLSVQVLVFPLVIYYFHQFPIWFLPANFVAAIFSFLLMILALLLLFFGALQLGMLAGFMGKMLVWVTTAFHQLIVALNKYTPDMARWLAMDGLDYLLLMGAIIALAVYGLQRHKWSLFAGLSVLLLYFINLAIQDGLAAQQEKVIVYAANNRSVIDLIKGHTACTYSDSTLSTTQAKFVLQPAHIGYRIRRMEKVPLQNTELSIQGKRIVLWTQVNVLPKPGMDYLILSGKDFVDPEWIHRLEPRQVVIGSGIPRKPALRLSRSLEDLGIPVHNVSEEGAWIFQK